MLRGLTSFQAVVDDIAEGERWYTDVLGTQPYFRSEDAGLPAGHVGFRVGDDHSELGVTDRGLARRGCRPGPPRAPIAYWQVDDVAGAFDRLISKGATPLQPDRARQGFVIGFGRGSVRQRPGAEVRPGVRLSRMAASGDGAADGTPSARVDPPYRSRIEKRLR